MIKCNISEENSKINNNQFQTTEKWKQKKKSKEKATTQFFLYFYNSFISNFILITIYFLFYSYLRFPFRNIFFHACLLPANNIKLSQIKKQTKTKNDNNCLGCKTNSTSASHLCVYNKYNNLHIFKNTWLILNI